MISDGGHFENLAAYELIRRQCRVIIISDAECDSELKFEGLARLIRICKLDFGTEILINDVNNIRLKTKSNWSRFRFAVGRIGYGNDKTGVLIYLKAAMSGSEDTAIRQYMDSHPKFFRMNRRVISSTAKINLIVIGVSAEKSLDLHSNCLTARWISWLLQMNFWKNPLHQK